MTVAAFILSVFAATASIGAVYFAALKDRRDTRQENKQARGRPSITVGESRHADGRIVLPLGIRNAGQAPARHIFVWIEGDAGTLFTERYPVGTILPTDPKVEIELSLDRQEWRRERPWRVKSKWTNDLGDHRERSDATVPDNSILAFDFNEPLDPGQWADTRRPWIIDEHGTIIIGPPGSFHAELPGRDRARASGEIFDGSASALSNDAEQWLQRVQDKYDREYSTVEGERPE